MSCFTCCEQTSRSNEHAHPFRASHKVKVMIGRVGSWDIGLDNIATLEHHDCSIHTTQTHIRKRKKNNVITMTTIAKYNSCKYSNGNYDLLGSFNIQ